MKSKDSDMDFGRDGGKKPSDMDKEEFDDVQYDIAQKAAEKYLGGEQFTIQIYDYMKDQNGYDSVQDIIDDAEALGKKYAKDPGGKKFQAATDKVSDLRASHKGSKYQLIDDLERMKKSEVEDIQSTLSAERERLLQKGSYDENGDPTFDNQEDTDAFWAAYKDASDFYNMTHHYGNEVRYKPEDKDESISINGQKYKAIKESKKNPHILKEIYDRTFRSLK
jgi:hypothetical protein